MLTKVCFGEKNDMKDQLIYTTRLSLWHINENDTQCGNLWFFYQRFFSQEQLYICPHDRLSLIIEGYNS